MANRTFFNTQAVNREVKFLSVVGKIEGTSSSPTHAVTLFQGDPDDADTPLAFGVTATADLSGGTNNVIFTFPETYNGLLGLHYTPKNSAAPSHVTDVNDKISNKDHKTVILLLNAAMAQDDQFYVTFVLKNTSVPR